MTVDSVRDFMERRGEAGGSQHLSTLGKTPLMVAAEARAVGTLELLLIRGAGPDVTDEDGRTALVRAP